MTLTFLSPLLLAGFALLAIPIALHLRRRREPVRVEFPALRLLKRNRHKTQSQLRLRRWLLLAARCLLLAALAAALARPLLTPSVDAGADAAPGEGTAIAVVIDNGPNAAYTSRNLTRLETAQQMAGDLLAGLPGDTTVVLADRSPAGSAASVEASTAAARVARLRISSAAKPLGGLVRDALDRLANVGAARREAYVFTDLSVGVWDATTREAVAATLKDHPGVEMRLVDVGVSTPRNAAVVDVRLPGESITVNQRLELSAGLEFLGEWNEPVPVQLWIEGRAGPVKRDERLVTPEGDSATVTFSVAGLEEGDTVGFVRVAVADGATHDDTRHFAVEIRRPPKVLIVAASPDEAVFVRAAIDPAPLEPGGSRRFETELATYDAWARSDLSDADAVLLLDPSADVQRGRGWSRLYNVASAGGGIGLFLGREASLDAFNSPDAQALLPCELRFISRDPTYLRPTTLTHPAIASLTPYAESIIWQAYPVFRRWELGPPRDAATVVAPYADGSPAIVETRVGRGRVLMMGTSVSDRASAREPWNQLPTGEDPWPFVLLANSITDYLTGSAESRRNFVAGEPVTVPMPVGLESPGYVLRTPTGEAVRQSIRPGARELAIPSAAEPGTYRVEAGAEVDRRFAVNTDPQNARLGRVDPDRLSEALGESRVEIVSDADRLNRLVDLGRVGRELYGWVLPLAALALVGEQFVSSRFYRQSPGETPNPTPA